MKQHSIKLLSAISAALVAVALPASAVTFDFYKLQSPTIGGDLLPDGVAGTDYFVNSGDNVSSNVGAGTFNGDLEFTLGGITATATATFGLAVAAVVQDHENAYSATVGAGLGVYHIVPVDTSDDNITTGEALTLTFNQPVNITSIGLRAEGHNFTGWTPAATFLLDGVSTLLPLGVGSLPVNLTGTQFTFAFGGASADQFYLSSLTASSVPEGGATVALLGLSMIGLGAYRRQFAKQ